MGEVHHRDSSTVGSTQSTDFTQGTEKKSKVAAFAQKCIRAVRNFFGFKTSSLPHISKPMNPTWKSASGTFTPVPIKPESLRKSVTPTTISQIHDAQQHYSEKGNEIGNHIATLISEFQTGQPVGDLVADIHEHIGKELDATQKIIESAARIPSSQKETKPVSAIEKKAQQLARKLPPDIKAQFDNDVKVAENKFKEAAVRKAEGDRDGANELRRQARQSLSFADLPEDVAVLVENAFDARILALELRYEGKTTVDVDARKEILEQANAYKAKLEETKAALEEFSTNKLGKSATELKEARLATTTVPTSISPATDDAKAKGYLDDFDPDTGFSLPTNRKDGVGWIRAIFEQTTNPELLRRLQDFTARLDTSLSETSSTELAGEQKNLELEIAMFVGIADQKKDLYSGDREALEGKLNWINEQKEILQYFESQGRELTHPSIKESLAALEKDVRAQLDKRPAAAPRLSDETRKAIEAGNVISQQIDWDTAQPKEIRAARDNLRGQISHVPPGMTEVKYQMERLISRFDKQLGETTTTSAPAASSATSTPVLPSTAPKPAGPLPTAPKPAAAPTSTMQQPAAPKPAMVLPPMTSKPAAPLTAPNPAALPPTMQQPPKPAMAPPPTMQQSAAPPTTPKPAMVPPPTMQQPAAPPTTPKPAAAPPSTMQQPPTTPKPAMAPPPTMPKPAASLTAPKPAALPEANVDDLDILLDRLSHLTEPDASRDSQDLSNIIDAYASTPEVTSSPAKASTVPLKSATQPAPSTTTMTPEPTTPQAAKPTASEPRMPVKEFANVLQQVDGLKMPKSAEEQQAYDQGLKKISDGIKDPVLFFSSMRDQLNARPAKEEQARKLLDVATFWITKNKDALQRDGDLFVALADAVTSINTPGTVELANKGDKLVQALMSTQPQVEVAPQPQPVRKAPAKPAAGAPHSPVSMRTSASVNPAVEEKAPEPTGGKLASTSVKRAKLSKAQELEVATKEIELKFRRELAEIRRSPMKPAQKDAWFLAQIKDLSKLETKFGINLSDIKQEYSKASLELTTTRKLAEGPDPSLFRDELGPKAQEMLASLNPPKPEAPAATPAVEKPASSPPDKAEAAKAAPAEQTEEAKKKRKEENYRAVAAELIDTEKSYLKQLEILRDLKPKVLADLNSPNSAILKDIPEGERAATRQALIDFFNDSPIDQLIESSKLILSQLEDLDPSQNSPDEYLKALEGFNVDACSKHGVLFKSMPEVFTAVKTPLTNMIKEVAPKERNEIGAILIVPIQRGPRYVLLLKELNKNVSSGQTTADIKEMGTKIDQMNAAVAGAERQVRSAVLGELSKLGPDEKLLLTDGKFVAAKTGIGSNPLRKGRGAMNKLLTTASDSLQAAKTPEHLDEIKAFIDKVESHSWSKGVLKNDGELGKKFEKLKQDYESKVQKSEKAAKTAMQPILDLQEKLPKPGDSKKEQLRYLLMTAVDSSAVLEASKAESVLSFEQLLIGYRFSMNAKDLFEGIASVLYPAAGSLPDEITDEEKTGMQLRMLKLAREWVSDPANAKELSARESIFDLVFNFKSDDPALQKEAADLRAAVQAFDDSRLAATQPKPQIEPSQTKPSAEWIGELTQAISSDPKAALNEMVKNIRTVSDHAYSLVDLSQEQPLYKAAELAKNISNLVEDHILSATDPKSRQKLQKFYLDAALKCIEQEDYNSAMLIFLGLNRTTPEKSKEVDRLDKLFHPEGKYKALRAEVQKKSNGRLPLPVAIGDLTFAVDGNKSSLIGSSTATSNVFKAIRYPAAKKPITPFIHNLSQYQLPELEADKTTLSEAIDSKRKRLEANLAEAKFQETIEECRAKLDKFNENPLKDLGVLDSIRGARLKAGRTTSITATPTTSRPTTPQPGTPTTSRPTTPQPGTPTTSRPTTPQPAAQPATPIVLGTATPPPAAAPKPAAQPATATLPKAPKPMTPTGAAGPDTRSTKSLPPPPSGVSSAATPPPITPRKTNQAPPPPPPPPTAADFVEVAKRKRAEEAREKPIEPKGIPPKNIPKGPGMADPHQEELRAAMEKRKRQGGTPKATDGTTSSS